MDDQTDDEGTPVMCGCKPAQGIVCDYHRGQTKRRGTVSHPIDIIANAIRVADGNHSLGAGQLAQVAADTLTDERIVECAGEALKRAGWDGMPIQYPEDLADIARIVLRSIAEPA